MYIPCHSSGINSKEKTDSYIRTYIVMYIIWYVAMYACPCISQRPHSM